MVPNIEYNYEDKGKRSLHVNPLWVPYNFGAVEFWLTEEE